MPASLVPQLDSRSQFSKADVDQLLGEEGRGRKGYGTEFLRRPKWNDEGLAHGPIKQPHQLVILIACERRHLSMEALHAGA